MSEVHRKSHQAATAHIPPFGLRLQAVLKAELEQAATNSGRSLNAEICDRLRQSFEPIVEMEPDALELLKGFAEIRRVSVAQALSDLIRAGVRDGGSKIVSLHISPGVEMRQLADQLGEAATAHQNCAVFVAGPPSAVGTVIGTMTGGVVRIKQDIKL